ncbi:MAG: SDR family oxidoreductase [Ignavibacteriota bacterium]
MEMRDNVAIVTGASRGIGLAIATELAGLGYSLGIVARTKPDIERAAESIRKQYPEVMVIDEAFDVVDGASTKNFVRRVSEELGTVSVLVNNAGDYKTGTSLMPTEETQRMMDVNFLAATRFVQAVLPSMKKSGRGYIFNIASMCGVQAFSDVGNYCASKYALVGYSSSLAQELAATGIKVTAVCPSWVNTRQAEGAPIEPDEMIQTNDIALTIRYLLTLGMSASIREIVIHCK